MRKPCQVREFTPSRDVYGKLRISICTHCGRPAAKEALFRNGNATVIEKYCDGCMKSEKFTALMTITLPEYLWHR